METRYKVYTFSLAIGEMILFFPFLVLSTISLSVGAILFHIFISASTFLILGTYFKENDDMFVAIMEETWGHLFLSITRMKNRL